MVKLYHKMFEREHFPQEVRIAVRTCIKNGLFKKDKTLDFKKALIYDLHNTICMIYNIPVIPINFDENFEGGGRYDDSNHSIIIDKPSLVTYLHEVYHYLAHTKCLVNSEDLARGYSISLYFVATPNLCENAILSGKIIHQNKLSENEEVGTFVI